MTFMNLGSTGRPFCGRVWESFCCVSVPFSNRNFPGFPFDKKNRPDIVFLYIRWGDRWQPVVTETDIIIMIMLLTLILIVRITGRKEKKYADTVKYA
jgi:hypothetical protein